MQRMFGDSIYITFYRCNYSMILSSFAAYDLDYCVLKEGIAIHKRYSDIYGNRKNFNIFEIILCVYYILQ